MKNHKVTKLKQKLPQVDIGKPEPCLPFNGQKAIDKTIIFSFSCFNRDHQLFNLGDNKTKEKVVGDGRWFLDLLDCLKDVSNKTLDELKKGMYKLHQIDWSKTNVKPPGNIKQLEYQQFRINKSKGRVIGFLIDNVFYVVWLDPHHNLTNSEGYGGVNKCKQPKSIYETQEQTITQLKNENDQLRSEIIALLDDKNIKR